MTESTFSLRQLGPQDGPAYAAVLSASPDTGSIGSAVRFEIDPYQALMALQRDTVGVVAETPGQDGFVGSGLIRFGQCQWEGEVRPSALLNTLVVHPDYRRQGVASRLAKWRVELARQRQGDGSVVWAIIQRNNTGSERAATKWATQFLENRVAIFPLRMRSRAPRRSRYFVVRPAQAEELNKVAEQLNHFYRDYSLYPPETGNSLAAWLAQTPFDTPFRHYQIVADEAGPILAGMGLSENYRLRTTLITHLPAGLRFLNRIFHVIPASGEMREVALSRIWYAPGQLKAARQLLQTMRWEWRERCTSLVFSSDIRSPLVRLLDTWDRFGKEVAGIAVRGPVPYAEDRLFYYA
jgi:GNAT superfamily N-acetyltransferase